MKQNKLTVISIIISLIVGLFAWGQDQAAKPQTVEDTLVKQTAESASQTESPPPDELMPPQAWALACAGVLFERKHSRHDRLDGGIITEQAIEYEKHRLKNDWGIDNRKELLDMLVGIARGRKGQHVSYLKYRAIIENSSPEELQEILILAENNRDFVYTIGVVQKYQEQLGDKGIIGWDYSRAICLCRWGYAVGYLEKEEAWKIIMSFAKHLQEKFSSWEELGQNNLIGREFWSENYTLTIGWLFEDAYQRLLDMPDSPWNTIPWNLPLTDEPEPEMKTPKTQTF